MARHLRVEFDGALYHVAIRMLGNWKREGNLLFEDDADRERFVSRLAERVEQYQIRLYLYCLMSNHVHLVFETPAGNCSRFMQSLSTAYTVYFNLRHDRHGHLLDGRFRAKLVEGDSYLLALSRYVHLNPVFVGAIRNQPLPERVERLRLYRWSSYPAYAGLTEPEAFVDYAPLLAEAGGKPRQQRRRYRQFVETGLAETDEDFLAVLRASPRCIGGEGFRAWVDGKYQEIVENRRRPEDAALRHVNEPLSADAVLAAVAKAFGVERGELARRRRDSPLRGVAARLLCRHAGLTQREAAGVLKIGSGAAVSLQLRSLAVRLDGDRELRARLADIETLLQQARPSDNL
jgi:putative transposase